MHGVHYQCAEWQWTEIVLLTLVASRGVLTCILHDGYM